MKDFITMRHLQNMAKVMLATGLIVAYGYFMEAFIAWYSGNRFELYTFKNRAFGPMGYFYCLLITCNIAFPQLLWLRKFRSPPMWRRLLPLIAIWVCWLLLFVSVLTS